MSNAQLSDQPEFQVRTIKDKVKSGKSANISETDKESKRMQNETIIDIRNVLLSIPVKSRELRTIKRVFIRSLTGGALYKSAEGTSVNALRNISCKIKRGDKVALIGHNGAGKSTFLRLIAGIYTPTRGQIKINCDVYPMLSKSFITGPDLSGAMAAKGHYLLMKGNLKGFEQYLDEVTEFSELGDFIHLPMKGYSDGMSARLLFTLLTSGKHDCLALDEGFGTGDSRFFAKAQERLHEFMDCAGTLILASHSDELLKQFCGRGLVFKGGEIIFDGKLEEALKYYHDNND